MLEMVAKKSTALFLRWMFLCSVLVLLFPGPTAAWTTDINMTRRHRNGPLTNSRVLNRGSLGQSESILATEKRQPTTTSLSCLLVSYGEVDTLNPVPVVVLVALVLLVGANGWINRLMGGGKEKSSSGLGDFLKDGTGYNKSGFSLSDSERAVSSDPLPWLRLPKLDFVEVAGQDNRLSEAEVVASLESLRVEMKQELAKGNVQKAEELGRILEELLQTNGMQFNTDDDLPGRRR